LILKKETIATASSGVISARLSRFSHLSDRTFPKLTLIFALVVVAILVGTLIVLGIDAWPAIQKFGIGFLSSSTWDPVKGEYGALPAIFGTVVTSLIGLIIAVPLSLGAAVFLVELSPSWMRSSASFLIEMLAAIPSVIIGLWAIYVLVPIVRTPIETWLGDKLGFLPLFQGPPFGFGVLAAGIILAIMIIPIITSLSREAMRAVPNTQREAMLALGATRWETISRAVIPYCRSGLVGSVILGLGRALGETMAVTMVIGNSYTLSPSLFSPGSTIASKIASEFNEAADNMFISSLVELALVLFAVTLFVNVIARLLVWRMTTVKAEKE
jgi:phosphate transport system permease protein